MYKDYNMTQLTLPLETGLSPQMICHDMSMIL